MSYNSETSLIMFKNILAILFILKLVKHSKFYASKFKFEDYSGLIYTVYTFKTQLEFESEK